MKKLIIVRSGDLAKTPAKLEDANLTNKIEAGLLALYDSDGSLITTDNVESVNKNSYISIFVGAVDANEMQDSVAMVQLKDLSYVRSAPKDGTLFKSSINITESHLGAEYTVVLAKKGVVFNERNKWSATVKVSSIMTGATIVKALAKQITANGKSIGLTATAADTTLTVSSTVIGDDWKLVPSDDLAGNIPNVDVRGIANVNDAVAIKDLYRQCIGDKGIYGTDPSGTTLYKEPVIEGSYYLYTLTFYNRRDNQTINKESVRQILHLAVPKDSEAANVALDSILTGLTTL